MRKLGIILCAGIINLGLWGAPPAQAQKKSVAEEILDILRADGKISDVQYRDLMAKAKAENEAREAGVEAFRRDSAKDVRKAIDWLNRFTFSGDLRVRHEGFYQDGVKARNRERFRFRFGAQLKISDELTAGFRIASGDPNDPISTNQTMGDLFNRKPLSIDQVYVTVTPGETFGLGDWPWKPLSITAGKMSNTLFRPRAVLESEMIWDGDVTPEGLAETFTLFHASEGPLRRLQLNAIQWSVDEAGSTAESFFIGGQFVGTFKLLPRLDATLGLGDYYLTSSRRAAQERNANGSLNMTNSLVLRDGTVVIGGAPFRPKPDNPIRKFFGGFNLLNAGLQMQWDTGYAKWPLSFFVDFVHNTEAETDEDTAVWVGLGLGQTREQGDWSFAAIWARTETDAVLSELSYSDFGRNGGTNLQGPFVAINYMILPRLTLTAKNHFVNFIDRPAGVPNSTAYRFQLDAQLAF
ncbi:MAG: putative porin [Thermodesulfobacteriota bacterium]|jgi:hypothetical protein